MRFLVISATPIGLPLPLRPQVLDERHVPRLRVADLDDEVRLGAVETQAVVEAAFDQLDDPGNRLRCFLGVGLELDHPLDGVEDDDRTYSRRPLGGGREQRKRQHAERNQTLHPFPTFVTPILGQRSAIAQAPHSG